MPSDHRKRPPSDETPLHLCGMAGSPSLEGCVANSTHFYGRLPQTGAKRGKICANPALKWALQGITKCLEERSQAVPGAKPKSPKFGL